MWFEILCTFWHFISLQNYLQIVAFYTIIICCSEESKHICRPVHIYKLSQYDSLKICRQNACPSMITMLAAVVWCSMHGLTCLQGIQGHCYTRILKEGRLFMPHTHCMGTGYWLFSALCTYTVWMCLKPKQMCVQKTSFATQILINIGSSLVYTVRKL